MEDTPLSMYSYWRRRDWGIFGTKLLPVKSRGRSGGRENQASTWISTKQTDFREVANCKFPNCSHGRTRLNLWRTTNKEISNVGLVMAAPIRSVMRDCKLENFPVDLSEHWESFNLLSLVCLNCLRGWFPPGLGFNWTLTRRRRSLFPHNKNTE